MSSDNLLPTQGATNNISQYSAVPRVTGGVASNGNRYRLIVHDDDHYSGSWTVPGGYAPEPYDYYTSKLTIDRSTDGGLTWTELSSFTQMDLTAPSIGNNPQYDGISVCGSYFRNDLIGCLIGQTVFQANVGLLGGGHAYLIPQHVYFDCIAEDWVIASPPPYTSTTYTPPGATSPYTSVGWQGSGAIAPGPNPGDCTIAFWETVAYLPEVDTEARVTSSGEPGLRITTTYCSGGTWSALTLVPGTEIDMTGTAGALPFDESLVSYIPLQGVLGQDGSVSLFILGNPFGTNPGNPVLCYVNAAFGSAFGSAPATVAPYSTTTGVWEPMGASIACTIGSTNYLAVPAMDWDSEGNIYVRVCLAKESDLIWSAYVLDFYQLYPSSGEFAPVSVVATSGVLGAMWVRPLSDGSTSLNAASIMQSVFDGVSTWSTPQTFRTANPNLQAFPLGTISAADGGGFRTVSTLSPNGFKVGDSLTFWNLSSTMPILYEAAPVTVAAVVNPTTFTFLDTTGEDPTLTSSGVGGVSDLSAVPTTTLIYAGVEAESLTSAMLFRIDFSAGASFSSGPISALRHAFCIGFPSVSISFYGHTTRSVGLFR